MVDFELYTHQNKPYQEDCNATPYNRISNGMDAERSMQQSCTQVGDQLSVGTCLYTLNTSWYCTILYFV